MELYDKVRAEVFQLQARNYILTSQSPPLSISIIESDNSTYQVPLQTDKSRNLVQSGMLQKYITDNVNSTNKKKKKMNQDVVFNHNSLFQKFVSNHETNSLYKLDIKETDKSTFDKDLVELSFSDFSFDASKRIEELESQKKLDPDNFSAHNENYLKSLKNSIKVSPAMQRKFFYEAGAVKQYKGMGFHRDKRFFNGDTLINDKQEYQARLNSMIRTFQKFTKANGIISWLSHGTPVSYTHLDVYKRQVYNPYGVSTPSTSLSSSSTTTKKDPDLGFYLHDGDSNIRMLPIPIVDPNEYLPDEIKEASVQFSDNFVFDDENKTIGWGGSCEVRKIRSKYRKKDVFALKKLNMIYNETPEKFYKRCSKEFIIAKHLSHHVHITNTFLLVKVPTTVYITRGWGFIMELGLRDLFAMMNSFEQRL